MEREIKFEIILQHKKDKDFQKEVFTYLDLYLGTAKNMIENLNGDGYIVICNRLYTGIKDKNGKEIYEGDIIPTYTGTPQVVKYENGVFMWGDEILSWDVYGDSSKLNLPEKWATVIGSIYETPLKH